MNATADASTFLVEDLRTWAWWHVVTFSVVVVGGMELLNQIIPCVFYRSGRIPDKSKTLEQLEALVRTCTDGV